MVPGRPICAKSCSWPTIRRITSASSCSFGSCSERGSQRAAEPSQNHVLTDAGRTRALVVLLRFAGCVTVSAFLAIFLPVEWMASTHRWLGLGEFPRAPVVDYLARSIAALYGFHGGLLLLVSGDPIRYRSIVSYIAFLNVVFGLIVSRYRHPRRYAGHVDSPRRASNRDDGDRDRDLERASSRPTVAISPRRLAWYHFGT